MSYFTLAADGSVTDASGLKSKDFYPKTNTGTKGSSPSDGTVYAGGDPDFDETTGKPKLLVKHQKPEFGHHRNSYYRGYLIYFDNATGKYKVLEEMLGGRGGPVLKAVFFKYFPSASEARSAIDQKIMQDAAQQSPATDPRIPAETAPKATAGKKLAVGGGLLAAALFLMK